MNSKVCVSLLLAAASTVLLLSCLVAPVSARSDGLLGYCNLSPAVFPTTGIKYQVWPYGRYGSNVTGLPNIGTISSGTMNWARAPEPTDFYTIRTSDSLTPATDVTTYTPGKWVQIHIRTTDLRRRFIGLVMYASNVVSALGTADTQVGSWKLIDDDFQTGPTCGPTAVTHTGAYLKPLHTRFWWKAPAGTGTVNFRVLIKQGEQNKGWFFYPRKTLILTEGPSPPAEVQGRFTAGGTYVPSPVVQSATLLGTAGRSCADVCYLETNMTTPFCNSAAIKAINSESALGAAVTSSMCKLPFFAGCAYAGAAQQNEDGFCSYRGGLANCPANFQGLNTSALPSQPDHLPDPCFTAPAASVRPVCVCSSNPAVQPKNPFTPAASPAQVGTETPVAGRRLLQASAASTTSSATTALFVALIGAIAASTKNSRMMLALLALVCVLSLLSSPASAHNYIKTQHRANGAAVSVPCQARIGNQPHVQVIGNQTFEIEWSNGHSDVRPSDSRFVIVPAWAFDKLAMPNITDMINEYVRMAPYSAYYNNSAEPELWRKHHLHLAKECQDDYGGNVTDPAFKCNGQTYFMEPELFPNHTDYIVREKTYMDKAHPTQYTAKPSSRVIQTRVNDKYSAKDRRISYFNAKYPWIETVEFFQISFVEHVAYNNQASLARFKVPARNGPGDYIVWFYWQGYKDCVDVNVLPGNALGPIAQNPPVVERYGLNVSTTGKPILKKIDHCEWTNAANARTMVRRLGPTRDVSQCVAECRAMGIGSCNSIQVVRAINPEWTLPYEVNVPWIPYSFNSTLGNINLVAAYNEICATLDVDGRTKRGCWNGPTKNANISSPAYANLTPDDFLCYGLVPARNVDFQVEEDYKVATEPEDPIFYSTCYTLIQPGGFLNLAEDKYEVPFWQSGDWCIDCAFQQSLAALNQTQVPDWAKGVKKSGCVACDLKASTEPVPAVRAAIVGADLPVAGLVIAAPTPTPVSSSSTAGATVAPRASSSTAGAGGIVAPKSSSTGGAAVVAPKSSSTAGAAVVAPKSSSTGSGVKKLSSSTGAAGAVVPPAGDASTAAPDSTSSASTDSTGSTTAAGAGGGVTPGGTTNDATSNSAGGIMGDNKLYLGLAIGGAALVLLLGGIGVFFAVKACNARAVSQKSFNNIARQEHGVALEANPVATSWQ